MIALALLASLSLTADRQLTIIFSGDNGGEVAPCG
jgi:hypothetical protein